MGTAGGYMKIGDIKGESKDEGHVDWVELLSCSDSVMRPMTVGSSGPNRHRAIATFGDILCTKNFDSSSLKLKEAVLKGTSFPKVELHLTTSSDGGKRTTYHSIELTNAMVTSWARSGATDGSSPPHEQFTLNFEVIKEVYDKLGKDNKSQGKIDYGWKVEEGVPA